MWPVARSYNYKAVQIYSTVVALLDFNKVASLAKVMCWRRSKKTWTHYITTTTPCELGLDKPIILSIRRGRHKPERARNKYNFNFSGHFQAPFQNGRGEKYISGLTTVYKTPPSHPSGWRGRSASVVRVRCRKVSRCRASGSVALGGHVALAAFWLALMAFHRASIAEEGDV